MIFLYAATGEGALFSAPPPPYQDPPPSYQATGFTVAGEERSQHSQLQEEIYQLRKQTECLIEIQQQQWHCIQELRYELDKARAAIEPLQEEKVARDLKQMLDRIHAAT